MAHALDLPIDPNDYIDPSKLIGPDIANPIIKTIALMTQHRPMDPATPLGKMPGVDLGLQTHIVLVPNDFWAAINKTGLVAGAPTTGGLPVAKGIIHKGLGDRAGIGFSGFKLGGQYIWGGDFKLAFSRLDEGPTWALRVCYTSTKLGFVRTKTWSPQLVVSKRLEFADPYMGIGFVTGSGKIEIPVSVPALNYKTVLTAEGKATDWQAFMGIRFVVPFIGLLMTPEFTYSRSGATAIGLLIGLSY